MATWWRVFLNNPMLVWPVVLLLVALDGVGLYHLVSGDAPDTVRAAPLRAVAKRPVPIKPPPPLMIDPPPVATVLQSGTLIVISKKSQHMYVFSDGLLWITVTVHLTPYGPPHPHPTLSHPEPLKNESLVDTGSSPSPRFDGDMVAGLSQ